MIAAFLFALVAQLDAGPRPIEPRIDDTDGGVFVDAGPAGDTVDAGPAGWTISARVEPARGLGGTAILPRDRRHQRRAGPIDKDVCVHLR